MSTRIRRLLNAAASDQQLLERITSDPRGVAREYRLNRDETARLIRSDVLVALAKNPFLDIAGKTQTVGTITITVTKKGVMNSGDPAPRTLEELSHERLLEVTRRILAEPDYAARVRAFIKR